MGMTARITRQITDYDNPAALATRLRQKRIAPLVELIRQAHARHGEVRIVDVGGTRAYWNILPAGLLAECRAQVTLVNLQPPGPAATAGDTFHYHQGDGCRLDEFADGAFHIAHSNSVIEHVGDWARMEAFARETRRLAESYFVQTPNFWFPLEPHWMTPCFHWLPEPWRIALVLRYSLGNMERCATVDAACRQVESARLLDRRRFAHLFPEARLVTERFFGLPKSLIAIREASPLPG
ncbi:hypothetical protein OTERR_19010 [Oryzomicrobium terrae]|uniref:Methyltransferase type 11 domain-containing protein n=2 Tax=Oryzomicrobium terrae TaxID=1735038 RepID=A0A5C1EB07_9RHOO|nr:hypothetical protein OTERR_19010 [Oryzomicrobium terrae]